MRPDTPSVQLICQAHIDPIWIWDWEEGLAEALATFEAAADILDEIPEFVFNHSESLLYGYVRDYRPELFERIKGHVATGRWVITGGWYLQPDCNLPLGESFARQILLGRKFFRDEFGVEPKVAYNFDSFGHNGNLPQFLRLAGYETYVHFRPLPAEIELPDFIYAWEGVDGTQIPTLRPPCAWYCTHPGAKIPDKIESMRNLARERGIPVTCFWGAGNHGGGATRADLEAIREVPAGDPPVAHASLEDYCRDVVVPLAGHKSPHRGELQKCFTGCYTSTMGIKQRNHRGEGLALAAERYAALAWWFLGEPYAADKLRSVWADVLYNQFHDILPGSAIRQGVASSAEIMGRAFTNAREVALEAQLALARSREAKAPLTVRLFNPHAVRRTLPVIVDLQLATHPALVHGKHLAVVDADGNPVARQLLPYRCNTASWRNTFLFDAELCAGGISEYRIDIREKKEPSETLNLAEASVEGFLPGEDPALHDGSCTVADHTPWYSTDDQTVTIRAACFEAVVCRRTGRLVSLVHRGTGAKMLSAPSGNLLVRADNNDAWGGGAPAYGDVVGRFELPDDERLAAICGHHDRPLATPAVRIVASGPLATVVEVISSYEHSIARTRYMFHRNQPYIDIELLLNWNERCRAVQLEFVGATGGHTYAVEIPHAATTRPRGNGEEPCGRWAMLVGNQASLALVNDGPGGVDVSGDALRQSLVRSPTFTGGGAAPKPGFMQEHMSLGEHIYRFKLLAGPTDEIRTALPLLADDLTLPFSYLCNIPLDASVKPGMERGTEMLTLTCNRGLVHVEAVKQSEDARGLIVRLAERGGSPAEATLTLLGAEPLELDFGPYQMQTVCFQRAGADVRVTPCDLLERPLRD